MFAMFITEQTDRQSRIYFRQDFFPTELHVSAYTEAIVRLEHKNI